MVHPNPGSISFAQGADKTFVTIAFCSAQVEIDMCNLEHPCQLMHGLAKHNGVQASTHCQQQGLVFMEQALLPDKSGNPINEDMFFFRNQCSFIM